MSIIIEIKDYAKSIGLNEIGLLKIEHLEKWAEKAYDYLPSAKTCISILLPYPLIGSSNSLLLPNQVRISEAGVSYDYHKLVLSHLHKITNYISSNYKKVSIALCDTHDLPERWLGKKSGLGIIGKNSFLLNRNYGTSTHIGLILTELEIPTETKTSDIFTDYCENCNKCLVACPNQAIQENRTIDINKCISYLTQKKELTDWDMNHMNQNLYGCDYCQMVCPYTQNALKHFNLHGNANPITLESLIDQNEIVTEALYLHSSCQAKTIIEIDNKTFKKTLAQTSAGWIGKKRLQRNAIISLRCKPNQVSIELLDALSEDPRVDIIHAVESTVQSIKEQL